jgi:hypothetical protein
MSRKAKWTVLTYIAAHNNLEQFGKKSLMEILHVGSTSDVVHGAFYDGKTGAGRYMMGDPGVVAHQEQLGQVDSGDPDRLIATATWLFEQYPAERYGLVLWSHGSGWEPSEIAAVAKEARPGTPADPTESQERAGAPGSRALFRTTLRALLKPDKPAERAILFDDGTGHALDTIELGRVVGAIADAVGQPLDLIGMDACLMATVEVAYQLRKTAAYMVASEELVPGFSWPYDLIWKRLRNAPDFTAQDLSALIVAEYLDYYREHPPAFGGGDITKIALDVSKTEALAAAMQRLAQALIANMPEAISCLEKAQSDVYLIETVDEQRHPSKFNYHLWDIVSVSGHLAARCGQAEVQAAAAHVMQIFHDSGLVVRAGHFGEWFDGIGGLSVYWLPPKKDKPRHISRYYSLVDFARDAMWDRMLAAYRYSDV